MYIYIYVYNTIPETSFVDDKILPTLGQNILGSPYSHLRCKSLSVSHSLRKA